ncbi:Cytochrome b5-like protein [Aphelenchoides bicaudatus]|nr:Cytochrome b5-like protein [Aphelenchoides bicaudatus]
MVQKLPQNLQNLPEYTEVQVRDAAGDGHCIVIIYDLVYDLTDFLDEHPGGAEVIYEMAGMDVTQQFEDVGHSKLARTVMLQYVIGRLASTEKMIPEHLINATLSALTSFIRG